MSNSAELDYLLKCVERRMGRPIKSPTDFNLLSLRIYETLQEQLSASTLKRIWGYISTEHTPRYSTLSTLSRFVGCEDWDDFCASQKSPEVDESGFISCQQVDSSTLAVGDRLELRWCPDRRCVIIYNGNDGFTVQESIGAKIVAGDTFRAMSFVLGHPLYITDLRHGGEHPQSYVAGSRHGLTSIILLK